MNRVPALIVAHPGHELLLHHWMERNHPVVFALTDGSGSRGTDRSACSVRVIVAAGGAVGPVFGIAPDRRWYEAILSGDIEFFIGVAKRIGAASVERGVTRIVGDPVEFFNPMHDLCAAVARYVTRMVGAATGREIELYDYPIECVRVNETPGDEVLELDQDALARKWAAATSITPLAEEVARHGPREAHAVERLRRVDPADEWPIRLPREPHYERVGREHVARGFYQKAITYARHVRPLAIGLTATSREG